MIRYFIFAIFGAILTSHWAAQASSNRAYEDWLYNIYIEFYEKAVPPQQWNKIINRQESDNYIVKYGDNLSQISANLLGSSVYWPKLWAVNSQLSNPHLIAENSQLSIGANGKLSFYPAAQTKIIYFPFKEIKEDGKTITKKKKVRLPVPTVKRTSVIKNFPESFPRWTAIYYKSKIDKINELTVNFTNSALSRQQPFVYLKSMIIEKKPSIIGNVLTSGRKLLYSKGQSVFVKIFGDVEIKLGQLLRVVDTRPVYFKDRPMAEGLLRVKAELKVIEIIENTAEAFYKEYKVTIKNSFFSVSAGDSIILGSVKKFSIPKNISSDKELPGLSLIIGGKALSSPELFNLYSLVYLNTGSKKSLKVGDIFPIYQNLKSRGGRQYWGDRAAAYINIIDVKRNTATAVVSKIMSDIKIGDRVGSFDQVSDLGSGPTERDWEPSDDNDQNFGTSVEGDLEEDLEEDLEGDLEEDLEGDLEGDLDL